MAEFPTPKAPYIEIKPLRNHRNKYEIRLWTKDVAIPGMAYLSRETTIVISTNTDSDTVNGTANDGYEGTSRN